MEAYKFRYSFSAYLPNDSWIARGTDEDLKNTDIASLEKFLEQCYNAMEKLGTEGIQIEYVKMNQGELIFGIKDSSVQELYDKVDIQGLLKLIEL